MQKLLFLSLLVGWFNVSAQDERRIIAGREYPIWYSRTKVLVKFKDPARALSILPENLSNQITKVVPIPSISGMAFLALASNLSKEAVDRTVGLLRQHPDVLLVHPLLLNQEGRSLPVLLTWLSQNLRMASPRLVWRLFFMPIIWK